MPINVNDVALSGTIVFCNVLESKISFLSGN